jgi:hypothetical protein
MANGLMKIVGQDHSFITKNISAQWCLEYKGFLNNLDHPLMQP